MAYPLPKRIARLATPDKRILKSGHITLGKQFFLTWSPTCMHVIGLFFIIIDLFGFFGFFGLSFTTTFEFLWWRRRCFGNFICFGLWILWLLCELLIWKLVFSCFVGFVPNIAFVDVVGKVLYSTCRVGQGKRCFVMMNPRSGLKMNSCMGYSTYRWGS